MEALDALPIVLDQQSVRITADGYLVADARVARTGIQEYLASELGLTDRQPNEVIRVYRAPEEVFATDAMASLAHRPMTMDHPAELVTSDNWKRYAIGSVGGEITRDGETIKVPLTLMDAAAIRDVQAGKRQLSVGYTCKLVFGDGVTPEGQKYDARQEGIRANHIAVCSTARGGPTLRIGDRRMTDEPLDGGKPVATKTITFDGLPLEVTDAAEAAINKLQTSVLALTTAKDAALAQVATLTTEKATLDAEVATLKTQIEGAKLTPAQLRDAARSFAAVVDKAKALGVNVTDDMDEPAIRKAAVTAKLGDTAKDWNDAQIAVSFDTLTAGHKASTPRVDPLRSAVADGVVATGDSASVRDAARTARYAN